MQIAARIALALQMFAVYGSVREKFRSLLGQSLPANHE